MRAFRLAEETPEPGSYEIRVEGELDLAVAPRLQEALERADGAGGQVLINMQDCEFIDSTGLAVILKAQRELAAKGRRMVVYGPSSQVLRILTVTGLTANGLVFDGAEEARAACMDGH
jgi:anti-anti-sigma factor